MATRRSAKSPAATASNGKAPPAREKIAERRDGGEQSSEVRLVGELRPVTTREERIAILAYWRAAEREFAPGHELDDWLAAERDVDAEQQSPNQPDAR